jgi:hypothetical protein
MLHSIRPRPRSERAEQAFEQAIEAAIAPAEHKGGRWAALVSLVALILSAFSLYETTLKQARPSLHVGTVMHYAHDPSGGVEVFAVPVTIANHGARDAIVTSLDLSVRRAQTGASTLTWFVSAYVGGNPANDKRPFTPLSIPGRGSYTGIVLFYQRDLKDGAPPVVAAAGEPLLFCVVARSEANQDYPFLDALLGAPPAAADFEAELLWFSAPELHAGKTLPMQIKDARRTAASPLAGDACAQAPAPR